MKHILGYINKKPILFDTDNCPVCKNDFVLAVGYDESDASIRIGLYCVKCGLTTYQYTSKLSIDYGRLGLKELLFLAEKAQAALKAYLTNEFKNRPLPNNL